MLKPGEAALTVVVVLVLASLFVVVVLPGTIPAMLTSSRPVGSPSPVAVITPSPSALPSPSPSPSPPSRTAAIQKLATDLTRIAGGARVSLSLVELSGTAPLALWSIKGDTTSDHVAGWYEDYTAGECFTRNVLALRVGRYSDNTAAHILLRYLGGSTALNTFARTMGATQPKFFLPNTTTSADLARIWASEATGAGGGAAAQKWLYPLMTRTHWETGIPAGTPRAPVVHQVSYNGKYISDAALVVNGPKGAYVLTICTYGPGYTAGWQVVARMANRVWLFEAARPA